MEEAAMMNITPQMLQAGATSCYQTAQEVNTELASLRSYVEELAGQWLGVSSLAYQNLMSDYDRYGKMLNDALTQIGDGLLNNMHNYTTTEATIESGLAAVNGAIPGARLG
jgi:WXG100 family type VII secretion target